MAWPPLTIVGGLAKGLRLLHSAPIAECPFDRTLAVTMPEARERTRLGLVDASDFDEVRRGRRATEVLAELEATRPATEDIVFTHADYCLPNVFARSVAYNLGPEWVVAL